MPGLNKQVYNSVLRELGEIAKTRKETRLSFNTKEDAARWRFAAYYVRRLERSKMKIQTDIEECEFDTFTIKIDKNDPRTLIVTQAAMPEIIKKEQTDKELIPGINPILEHMKMSFAPVKPMSEEEVDFFEEGRDK